MIVAIALSFSAAADAQIYIKVRPHHPVIKTRPPRPSAVHVWVGGEWVYSNRRYNYRDGYWDRPTANYSTWVEGHWKHSRRGWVWIPGHWR